MEAVLDERDEDRERARQWRERQLDDLAVVLGLDVPQRGREVLGPRPQARQLGVRGAGRARGVRRWLGVGVDHPAERLALGLGHVGYVRDQIDDLPFRTPRRTRPVELRHRSHPVHDGVQIAQRGVPGLVERGHVRSSLLGLGTTLTESGARTPLQDAIARGGVVG